MSRRPRVTADPALVAVVESREGDCSVALWRRTSAGPRLEREATVPPAALSGFLESSAAARTVVLLGGGQSRCRVYELPKAPEAQLESALRLQVEGAQLGSVPAHRVVVAVLPPSTGTTRHGVSIDWPPSEAPPALPAVVIANRRVTFASDPTALVAMACTPGVRGPLLFVDGAKGLVSLAIHTPRGLAVRSAREDVSDGADAVVRLVAETALHHGVDAGTIDLLAAQVREAVDSAAGAGFGCTRADRERLAAAIGAPIDAGWWRTHARTAGTAIAATGPLQSLAGLLAHEPGEEPDALGRVLNRLTEPRVLTGVIVAAIAALALGPLAIAFLDYQLMRWKVSSVGADQFRSIVAANDRLITLYKERSTRTWPMTKLLADLACCTPEGIDFEQVTIVHDETISIRGKAHKTGSLSGPDLILRMEQLMQESGVFDKIIKGWDPPNQLGDTQFTLSAAITRPTHLIALSEEQDWGKRPLVERRYGPIRRNAEPDGAGEAPGAEGAGEAGAPIAERSSEADAAAVAAEHSGVAAAAEGDRRAGPGESGAAPATAPATARAATPPAPDGTAAAGAETPPAAEASGAEGAAAENARRAAPESGRRPEDRNLASSGSASGAGPVPNERAGRAGPGTSEPEAAPESPSDQQIAAMSKEEALAAASAIAKARSNKSFDEETRKRLKEDFDRLMAHIRSKS